MHSGSALALPLPRDHAKEGVVRSRTLGACNLSWCLLRYRTHQNVPPLVRGGGYYCRLRRASLLLHPALLCLAGALCTCLCWKALFRPVVFTCTLCVALVDSLVSQVGSSLAPSSFVPGGWVDLSSCYVRNGLLAGFCDSGLRLRFCTAFRIRLHSSCGYRLLVRSRLRGVFEHELLFHISLLGLRALFLIGPPFRLRSLSSCDHDVCRLDGCGFHLLAGRDCVPFSSAC